MRDHVVRSGHRSLIPLSFVLLLFGCSKHEMQYPTPWLRVEVSRPRSAEFIQVGSIEERYEVKLGDRWKKLGVGHRSGYKILGEEALTAPAAVVTIDDPRGTWLVRPDAASRRLEGGLSFPNGMTVDAMQYADNQAHIERYDAATRQDTTFDFRIPDVYQHCTFDRVMGYANGVPYVRASCDPSSSRTRCLLVGAGKSQDVYAVNVDQPESDCEFRGLHLSMATPSYRNFD